VLFSSREEHTTGRDELPALALLVVLFKGCPASEIYQQRLLWNTSSHDNLLRLI
jgi:hypothetical protein